MIEYQKPTDIPDEFLVTISERTDRFNICKNCKDLTVLKMCSICNCFMPLKTWIKSRKCPVSKW